jgi:hypothetical protein
MKPIEIIEINDKKYYLWMRIVQGKKRYACTLGEEPKTFVWLTKRTALTMKYNGDLNENYS